MREAIRQLLITAVPDVAGRVFEPQAADHTTEKPFLVVREGDEHSEADWADLSTMVEVWPYVDQTSFVSVDDIAAKVMTALRFVKFDDGGEPCLSVFLDTASEDAVDEDWKAITRCQRFRVFALGWLSGLTYDPDPVAALQTLTAGLWPAAGTDPPTCDPSDAAPGIYWRLTGVQTLQTMNWGSWMTAHLRGHIVAPTPASRLTWSRKVAEALPARLRLSDGSPLLRDSVAADPYADPMSVGQISLTARFGVLSPVAPATRLNHATLTGVIEPLEVP